MGTSWMPPNNHTPARINPKEIIPILKQDQQSPLRVDCCVIIFSSIVQTLYINITSIVSMSTCKCECLVWWSSISYLIVMMLLVLVLCNSFRLSLYTSVRLHSCPIVLLWTLFGNILLLLVSTNLCFLRLIIWKDQISSESESKTRRIK